MSGRDGKLGLDAKAALEGVLTDDIEEASKGS